MGGHGIVKEGGGLVVVGGSEFSIQTGNEAGADEVRHPVKAR